MLVELVRREPDDDDGDFEFVVAHKALFWCFWIRYRFISAGTPERGCITEAQHPLLFEMGGIGALT